MRPAKTLLPLTFAVSALLVGCGGGGGDSTSTPSTTATTTQTSTAPQPKPKPKGGDKSQGQSVKPPQPSGSSPTSSAPLPNQGTKAVAPGVPTSKGGDNSIQTYGLEADVAERLAAAATAQAYLSAQAAGQWDAACSYLSAKVRSGLAGLAQKAKKPGIEGCAGGMSALLARAPQGTLAQAAKIDVVSMRLKGPQAFIVYRDGTGKPFNLPLNREGGAWKVGALVGIGLVL